MSQVENFIPSSFRSRAIAFGEPDGFWYTGLFLTASCAQLELRED